MKVIYMGVFIPNLPEEIKKIALITGAKNDNLVKHPHITYKFRPSDEEVEEFTKNHFHHKTAVNVLGYGILYRDEAGNFNEEGNGDIVNIALKTSHISNGKMTEKINEHITLAVLNGGKAVDSGLITRWKVPEGVPTTLSGVFGFFVGGENPVIY